MSYPLLGLCAALAIARLLSLAIVFEPGYTDAYYYANVASRLAHGDGLTADFVWNFLEAPALAPLPVASHRFWMPLASVAQALGIAAGGTWLGDFRAGQLVLVIVALTLPALTYALAARLGASARASLVAASLAGAGGAFAPAWVSTDSFALAAALGSLFFLVHARAARGSVSAGALAGFLVGVLFLARAEAALFGLAPLALVRRPATRAAGLAGSAVALAIGLAWLARDLSLPGAGSVLVRSVLLPRYDAFFALDAPAAGSLPGDLGTLVGARVGALATNAGTAALAFFLFLAPLVALGAWRARDRADVRAFFSLAIGIYLVESLVFTLHSTRGSYFHSLAAFFPFGIALAAATAPSRLRAQAIGAAAIAGAIAVSAVAVQQWDLSFNSVYRARAAAASLLPPGPVVAIDAAAWRWISGRPAFVTPSDGADAAFCVARRYGAGSIVLEPAHFAAYDALYASATRADPSVPSAVAVREGIEIFAPRPPASAACPPPELVR